MKIPGHLPGDRCYFSDLSTTICRGVLLIQIYLQQPIPGDDRCYFR